MLVEHRLGADFESALDVAQRFLLPSKLVHKPRSLRLHAEEELSGRKRLDFASRHAAVLRHGLLESFMHQVDLLLEKPALFISELPERHAGILVLAADQALIGHVEIGHQAGKVKIAAE